MQNKGYDLVNINRILTKHTYLQNFIFNFHIKTYIFYVLLKRKLNTYKKLKLTFDLEISTIFSITYSFLIFIMYLKINT